MGGVSLLKKKREGRIKESHRHSRTAIDSMFCFSFGTFTQQRRSVNNSLLAKSDVLREQSNTRVRCNSKINESAITSSECNCRELSLEIKRIRDNYSAISGEGVTKTKLLVANSRTARRKASITMQNNKATKSLKYENAKRTNR